MKHSKRELRDLAIAGTLISVAFAIMFAGGLDGLIKNFHTGILLGIVVAFFTAGVGFLFHELMHKYVAQHYGLSAEFRAFYPMLGLMVLLSLGGFLFAAPGAVMIGGSFINREKNGKISVAGPVANIVLAFIFLILVLVFAGSGFWSSVLSYGLSINALLAAFNMIPVMPFDGAKVLAWNKMIYGVVLAIALGLFAASWLV